MIFKEMEKTDLKNVCFLEERCFKNPWNHADCEKELDDNPFSHGWILIDEDKVVGYAFLWEMFEAATLARIGVDPECRQKGYGFSIMEHLCERARNEACEFMTLEVRESNEKAIKLYEKCGFIQVNVSKGYYPDGENAIIMTKAL